MKNKMKLVNIHQKDKLSKKDMAHATAGHSMCFAGSNCACGCEYEGGGSSTYDNAGANYDGGLHTPGFSYENCDEPVPMEN